jgi:solute carrier family 25 S-adenosylmethionine transporter 26
MAQSRAGSTMGTWPLLQALGPAKLVSGCATTSSFALLVGGLQFAIVGALTPRLGLLGASACGAVGSCVASVPQEVLKQRLIMGVYPSFAAGVLAIARTDGLRGFYAGWLPTAARNVPFVVTTFTAYGAFKDATLQRRRAQLSAAGSSQYPTAKLSMCDNVLLGVASALLGGLVTQPMDVVKTRWMTQTASAAAPYTSVSNCVATMWRTEGWASFYRGLPQRSLYMGPLWAIQFAANGWISERMLTANAQSLIANNKGNHVL